MADENKIDLETLNQNLNAVAPPPQEAPAQESGPGFLSQLADFAAPVAEQIAAPLIASAIGGEEAGAIAAGEQDKARAIEREAKEKKAESALQAQQNKEKIDLAKRKQKTAERLADLQSRALDLKNAKSAKDLEGKQTKLTSDLRKERNALPTTKDTQAVASAFSKVQKSTEEPSAAGDLALIFNFMKMLDPGSVVREGEFANAQNAAGVPQRIRAQFNRLKKGERLGPEQRQDFLNQANNVFQAQKQVQDGVDAQFSTLARLSGIDPSTVIISFDPFEANSAADLRRKAAGLDDQAPEADDDGDETSILGSIGNLLGGDEAQAAPRQLTDDELNSASEDELDAILNSMKGL